MKNVKEILAAGYKRATSDNHLTLITTIYGDRINYSYPSSITYFVVFSNTILDGFDGLRKCLSLPVVFFTILFWLFSCLQKLYTNISYYTEFCFILG
jgi:hypothetical protein